MPLKATSVIVVFGCIFQPFPAVKFPIESPYFLFLSKSLGKVRLGNSLWNPEFLLLSKSSKNAVAFSESQKSLAIVVLLHRIKVDLKTESTEGDQKTRTYMISRSVQAK